MSVKCPICGDEHDCSDEKRYGETILPCGLKKELGGIRVHVVEEETYLNIAEPIQTTLSGGGLTKPLNQTTDRFGTAAFDDIPAGKYTVWLGDLSEEILKTHRAPARDSRDLSVRNGEISYVPFLLPRALKVLRLQMFDMHNPRAEQSFQLDVFNGSGEPLGPTVSGKTDKDGMVEKQVDPKAASGTMVVGPDKMEVKLNFTTLKPLTETAGVEKRLKHLGYLGELKDALLEFERDHGLEPTGKCEGATKAKLEDVHDKKFTYTESRK